MIFLGYRYRILNETIRPCHFCLDIELALVVDKRQHRLRPVTCLRDSPRSRARKHNVATATLHWWRTGWRRLPRYLGRVLRSRAKVRCAGMYPPPCCVELLACPGFLSRLPDCLRGRGEGAASCHLGGPAHSAPVTSCWLHNNAINHRELPPSSNLTSSHHPLKAPVSPPRRPQKPSPGLRITIPNHHPDLV